jgi:outer membrane autotransporter protein
VEFAVQSIDSQMSARNANRQASARGKPDGFIVARRASKKIDASLAAAIAAAFGFACALSSNAMAQTLGTAEDFAVLGGSTVTNTGPSIISGSVGVYPGTAITGFPPGIVLAPGTFHSADAVAQQAQADVVTAYTTLQGLAPDFDLTGQDLGGLTLSPAVYSFTSSAQLTGVLTLNGLGDPNAEFVFQIGSTLTTASNSSVLLINGANGDNVYWAVGSSATLGTNTSFVGNILALESITLNTGASIVCGRALAQNGAVTLDDNTITLCVSGITGGGITGDGDVDITTAELFGEGVTGVQQTTFGTVSLFGSAMMTQGTFWRNDAPQGYAFTPQSLKDAQAGSLKDSDAPVGSLKDEPVGSLKDSLPDYESAMPGYDPRRTWRLWAGGFGGTGSFDGAANLGTSDLDTRTLGFSAGLDYQIDPTTLLGIAGGYTHSRYSVDELRTKGNSEGGHVGVYGVKTYGQAYLAASADYARFENETARYIDWLIDEQAYGEFGSDAYGARFEVGYKQQVDRFNVTPFAGMAISHLESDGFSEDSFRVGGGPGGLGLTYDGISQDSVTSSVGVQLDTRVELEDGQILIPFARVAWIHEFDADRSITGSLSSSPDFTFTTYGASAAEDLAKVNAGFSLDMTGGFGVFASFDGEFSDSSQSYTGNGGIRITW